MQPKYRCLKFIHDLKKKLKLVLFNMKIRAILKIRMVSSISN